MIADNFKVFLCDFYIIFFNIMFWNVWFGISCTMIFNSFYVTSCWFSNTVFPLISTGGVFWIWKLSGAVLIRGWCYLEGDAYFKVKKMGNIKCQNLFAFSFKMEMKHNITKVNMMKKSKYQQYFHCFIRILLLFAF